MYVPNFLDGLILRHTQPAVESAVTCPFVTIEQLLKSCPLEKHSSIQVPGQQRLHQVTYNFTECLKEAVDLTLFCWFLLMSLISCCCLSVWKKAWEAVTSMILIDLNVWCCVVPYDWMSDKAEILMLKTWRLWGDNNLTFCGSERCWCSVHRMTGWMKSWLSGYQSSRLPEWWQSCCSDGWLAAIRRIRGIRSSEESDNLQIRQLDKPGNQTTHKSDHQTNQTIRPSANQTIRQIRTSANQSVRQIRQSDKWACSELGCLFFSGPYHLLLRKTVLQ